MHNTRLKDYYDLYWLAQRCEATPMAIASAIEATFERRHTPVSDTWPVGLTQSFAADGMKQRQWDAFLAKNRVVGPTLTDAIQAIRQLLSKPLELARPSR